MTSAPLGIEIGNREPTSVILPFAHNDDGVLLIARGAAPIGDIDDSAADQNEGRLGSNLGGILC